ncbi:MULTISPECIES: hypothetical protein [Paraburkholderia]|jgi:hypothetical protein|uniref:Uncharacterized protein n=1 Tax=Paraburkholderia dipogonis TaxID=1211383 RepID=A0ABW9B5Q4_9BURK
MENDRKKSPDIRPKHGNGAPNDSRIAGWASSQWKASALIAAWSGCSGETLCKWIYQNEMKHRVRLAFTSGSCSFDIPVADFDSEFVTWQSHPVH